MVRLAIKCPSLNHDAMLTVAPGTCIGEVKLRIHETWPGHPAVSGMRFIRNGRLLEDEVRIDPEEGGAVLLHLVIRPDAWDVPSERPTTSRRTSHTPPMMAEKNLAHLVAATAPPNLPLLRTALIHAHTAYLDHYVALYKAAPYTRGATLPELERVLLAWPPLQLDMQDQEGATKDFFQHVTHNGLPFLLRLSVTAAEQQRAAVMQELLERLDAIRAAVVMLDSLVVLQPPAPAPAPAPVPAAAPVGNAMPLPAFLWLTCKVGLMAWILTRNMHAYKAMVVFLLAALYILHQANARQPRPAEPRPVPLSNALDGIAQIGLDGQGGWFYVNLAVPLFLFFATMVPEVEGLRRRALEQRRT